MAWFKLPAICQMFFFAYMLFIQFYFLYQWNIVCLVKHICGKYLKKLCVANLFTSLLQCSFSFHYTLIALCEILS